jgi:hypothetical protein
MVYLSELNLATPSAAHVEYQSEPRRDMYLMSWRGLEPSLTAER